MTSSKKNANGGTGDQPGRRRGLRAALFSLLGLVVLAVAGYLALVLTQGEKIASGTTVGGIDVGGRTTSEATSALASRAAQLEAQPITVTADGKRLSLVPSASGLKLDPAASVRGLGQRDWNPVTAVQRVFGSGQERGWVTRNTPARTADVAGTAAEKVLTGAAKNGSVSFHSGDVEVVRSSAGRALDGTALAKQIDQAWPTTRTFTAVVTNREPALSNTEIDRYVKAFATPAMSGPVTITHDGKSATLSPTEVSAFLSTTRSGGTLKPRLDAEKLADAVIEKEPDLRTPPTNPKVSFSGSIPTVAAAKPGQEIDPTKLAVAVQKALAAPQQRTVQAPMREVKSQVTAADVKGVTSTVIYEFRSKFPGGASNRIRTQNMRTALAAINGTVVGKGQQFSLIDTLGGDLTPERGYGAAPTIQGGKERAAQGGGVSQVSTAVYNAAFFSGVQLDSHKAHSFWIERYPAGREATLWVPNIDNTWTNDTDAPIVVTGRIEGDEVVVGLLGKRKYQVEEKTSEKYNIRQPKTVYDDHPGCLPVPTNIGFDIDVTRILKQNGRVVKTQTTTTKYAAANRVICS
ncbi:VanW family protein [Dermacoccaceae bacterium W4C1]